MGDLNDRCCFEYVTNEQLDEFAMQTHWSRVKQDLRAFTENSINSDPVAKIKIITLMLEVIIELLDGDNSTLFSTYCRLSLKKVLNKLN